MEPVSSTQAVSRVPRSKPGTSLSTVFMLLPFLVDMSVALFVGVIAEFDPVSSPIAEDKEL